MPATATRLKDEAKYYSIMVSPNMEMTGEGYLICRNVPICRSGTQEYYGHELVGFPGYEESWGLDANTKYTVYRPANEVLHPDTIKSFEGKSICDEHPDTEGHVIRVDNERDLNCGHIQDVKEGPKYDGEVTLQGDLHIKDPDLIEKIRPPGDPESGIRDVSCGYLLRLKRLSDGKLIMYYIRGNHVAVVTKGRAGPRIAIRDSAPPEIIPRKGNNMSLLDKIFGRGLKEIVAEATPEELAELTTAINAKGGVRAVTRLGVDADPAPPVPAMDKDPHRMAAHSCLDRCMDAMKHEKGMGVDAAGKPCAMDALRKELGHYVGKDEEPKKEATDSEKEKVEELKESKAAKDEEEEQAEKTAAEEKDEMHATDGEHAEKQIDDPGESVLKAANDSVRQLIKSQKPLMAAIANTPKSERSPEDQAMLDSYNSTVKALNSGNGITYSVFTKVRLPERVPALATDSEAKTVEPCTCFDGVPYKVGVKNHEKHLERLAQKGNK